MSSYQDLASKWTTAYNNGDAGKVADLYTADAAFLSGVLGALKGKTEIETAISRSITKEAVKHVTHERRTAKNACIYNRVCNCKRMDVTYLTASKQAPKITFNPVEAHENGNIVWGYRDYTFPDGPSGYGAITAVKEADAWHIAMHISNVKPKKQ